MPERSALPDDPVFTRGDVAKILNVTPLTIANREKGDPDNGRPPKYPAPRRDLNNHRVYSIDDVLNLQLITFDTLDTRPIISVLYDKGYRDTKAVGARIDAALNRRKGY